MTEGAFASGFVRHGSSQRNGASCGDPAPTRWSFRRCSVRSLASLLKRGKQQQQQQEQPQKQKQQQHQLASLSNDLSVGNHCRPAVTVYQSVAAPPETTDSDPTLRPPRIRTTVLGCPRKLRASMPVRLSQPPATTGTQDSLQLAAATASPLFQVKRNSKKQQQPQQPQQQDFHQCQLHGRSGNRQHHQQTLASIPDDDELGAGPPASLLLELGRELRQVALVGWRRHLTSLPDVWSLFASQWPAQVQALGTDWRVSVLRPNAGRWETLGQEAGATVATAAAASEESPLLLPHGSHLRLESGSAQCPCSCACTCRDFGGVGGGGGGVGGGGSQQRIERLEAEVTSLSRRLQLAAPPATPATPAPRRTAPIDEQRLRDLRDECRKLRESRDALRRDHERRARETRQMMSDLASSVRRVLSAASAAEPSAETSERRLREAELRAYQLERAEVSGLIEDIDETTGELRQDVLRRRCRSNPAEVELLALHLSRATQRLASLKNRFPAVRARTRDLLQREAATAAGDERVLAEEAERLDGWLRKVKRLTMMLYTFKQLAEAQAKEPPTVLPVEPLPASCGEEARRDLLRGVLSVCPDHAGRAHAIERAEIAIERRRRMLREAAALKAEKTLTAAASRLKPVPVRQRAAAAGAIIDAGNAKMPAQGWS